MALESTPLERGKGQPMPGTERDAALLKFVKERVSHSKIRLTAIRDQWKANFDCFAGGSKFTNKEDWQSQFSVNEVAGSVRTGVSKIRNNFLKRPDWFTLTGTNEDAIETKQALLDKAIRYQLKRAKFRRVANTFLLSASLSLGVLRVGWKLDKIKNPKLILKNAEKEMDEFNKKVASSVENPQIASELPTDAQSLNNVETDVANLLSQVQGDNQTKAFPEFIQTGMLELKPVNPFDFYFDPDCTYPDESSWHAEESYVPVWKLKQMGKNGIYKNTEGLVAGKVSEEKALNDSRFKNLSTTEVNSVSGDLIKITEYFGNIVVGGQELESYWHVVLANESVVILDKANSFWADGYESPYVIAMVHEIPFKPTGASMVDGAIPLQRILDSNYQLTVDQMRLGIVGLNIIDRTKIIDASTLLDGIEPGKYLEVNGKPDDVFKHYNLTSNVENTVFPMNTILVQGIQKATGVSPIIQGYAAQRARTSAAEIQTQQNGSEGVLFTSAEDLEIQWLIPMLQKTLARILQFGLNAKDPQFMSTLEESELMALQEFAGADRYNNFAQYWEFEINGFASESMRLEEVQNINEALTLYNTPNSPLSQIINGPYLMREWARKINFRDPSKIVIDNSELDGIVAENRLLMNGHQVSVNPNDNHQLHIPSHQKVQMLGGGNTPEMGAHIQQHIMAFQQMQAQQQAVQQANQGKQPGAPARPVTSGDLRASGPTTPRPPGMVQ